MDRIGEGGIRFIFLIMLTGLAIADEADDSAAVRAGIAPDIRDVPLPAKIHKGSFVAVPIPFSNPTLENGLVAVGAYFYPQSEAQKSAQPPTVTGLGAMSTSNGSWGAALGHSAYWDQDRWRFAGALGFADVKLPLLAPGTESQALEVDWLLQGSLAYASLSRRFGNNWYAGLVAQYVDIEQGFSFDIVSSELVLGDTTRIVALGPSLSYDTRDVPANAYKGRYFKATALTSRDKYGSDLDYESYSLSYRSYHQIVPSAVLAWEVNSCMKSGDAPLWDACRIGLRGFASTNYMGKSSVRTQVELRWRLSKRWGVAAFAGAGQITESLVGSADHDVIPSYGTGLRFTIQPEQRIVMRLDYGRSTDSDAWYLSVGQAF